MKAEKIREKFKTAAGRKAFDRLNNLGAPKWSLEKTEDGVILSPSMAVTIAHSGTLRGFGDRSGKTLDEAAIQLEKDLKWAASTRSMLVITNPASKTDRSVHQYNTVTRRYNKI